MDNFSKEKRSEVMRSVRSTNTTGELLVRKALRLRGLNYRLFGKHLPGCPDIYFTKARVAIQVRGCFWHLHTCKKGRRLPATNREFWIPRLTGNRERDRRNDAKLRRLGWSVLVIWECKLSAPALQSRLDRIADEIRRRHSLFLRRPPTKRSNRKS